MLADKRTELVADQTVEHPPCLLRVDEVHVDVAWVAERLLHSGLSDLVKDHTFGILRHYLKFPQRLHDVPGDGLAFAVRVCRQVHRRGLASGGGNLLDELGFAAPVAPAATPVAVALDHILRFKVVLNIDAKAADGQITHVSERRHDGVLAPQDALYGPRLGW